MAAIFPDLAAKELKGTFHFIDAATEAPGGGRARLVAEASVRSRTLDVMSVHLV